MRTCLLLSAAAHLAILAWTGSGRRPALDDRFAPPSMGNVMMTEWIDAPEAVPRNAAGPVSAPVPAEAPDEAAAPMEAGDPGQPPSEPVLPVPSGPVTAEGGPAGEAAAGKRLNLDLSRIAWVQGVVERSSRYQRNAPKGFEGMVRSALSLHPAPADGRARVSMKFDPAGTVSGVDIRSDSPELKAALARVGWETGPLPSRYRIPCSGLIVNVKVTGSNLSVGVVLL